MVLNGTAISRATDDAVKPGILAKKRAISSNLVDFLWARSKIRNNRSIMNVRANHANMRSFPIPVLYYLWRNTQYNTSVCII